MTSSPRWKEIIDSPPMPLQLPVYAEGLANEFVRAPPVVSRKSKNFRGDPRVLQFMDDVADEDSSSCFVSDCTQD